MHMQKKPKLSYILRGSLNKIITPISLSALAGPIGYIARGGKVVSRHHNDHIKAKCVALKGLG